jgi:TRAP transporter 4TM/12TM fusion protein
VDETQEKESARTLVGKGALQTISKFLCIAISLVGCFFTADINLYFGLNVMREQYYGILIALVLACTFLLYPATRGTRRTKVPWYDIILSILGFCVGMYVAVGYRKILWEIGIITPDRVIMGFLAVVLVLEGVRRTLGYAMVIIGALFILYARFAWLIPGMFGGDGVPWDRLLNYLYLDPNGLLGAPTEVAAYIILSFVLFGSMLFLAGGGKFILGFSQSIFGRFRGGPAKVSVVASSLFGMISGSAVANVAAVGVVTIPMMKASGQKPHIAAAIETVSSTGGQLMPPVMGAAAFVMASFIGVPYRDIAIAAALPAILYYMAIFFQVDLEAGKSGLTGVPREELPPMRGAMFQSYLFFIPFIVLCYTLFILWLPAGKAAVVTAFSIYLLSFLKPETRFRFGWLLEALENTGRSMIDMVLVVGVACFVIGVLNVTGLSFVFTMFLGMISGKNVLVLLVIIAAVSTVLGMGMPTTAVYILLASLMAAALVEAGIPVMVAHMFIFYTAMLSMITPPVALAAYAAANIARTDPMITGYTAMRLGFTVFILPFIFTIWPVLMLKGSPWEIFICALSVAVGITLFAVFLVGYIYRKINLIERILFGVAGIGFMILPKAPYFTVGLVSHIIGGIILSGLILWEWGKRTKLRKQSILYQVMTE